jgi:glutathione peroxidase
MKDKKLFESEQNDLNVDKEIFTVDSDEEVLNCEGSPCNFVYTDIDKK